MLDAGVPELSAAFEVRIVPVPVPAAADMAELGAIEVLGRGYEPGRSGRPCAAVGVLPRGPTSLRVLAICLPASRVTMVAAGPSSLSQRCA